MKTSQTPNGTFSPMLTVNNYFNSDREAYRYRDGKSSLLTAKFKIKVFKMNDRFAFPSNLVDFTNEKI